jgi:diadenylate cyclase
LTALAYLASHIPQVLDILAVAVLLYYSLVYVRGTKVMAVAQATIVLAGVYFACQYFKLITLVFLLEKVLFVAPIALFIIFAPEIRKAFERAGRRSPLIAWLMPREGEQTPLTLVDTIADTVFQMGEERIGALIVIEGDNNVDEHIVPGVELDAKLSQRFLASIFDERNPLHDGAVVIRGELVHSASNFLPISESILMPEGLGTRHRAAMGVVERCDAVAVVVSEESGEVSIAYSGRLARNLSQRAFREQLTALLEPNVTFSTVVARPAFL